MSGCSAANDSYGKHTEHHLHPALSTSHLTSLTPLPANTVVHGFTPSASPCPTPRMLEVQLDADQATPQATCVKICRRIDLTSSLKQSRFLQYSGTHPLQQCSSNLQGVNGEYMTSNPASSSPQLFDSATSHHDKRILDGGSSTTKMAAHMMTRM